MRLLTFAFLAASCAGALLFAPACGEDKGYVRPADGRAPLDVHADGALACGAIVPPDYESAGFDTNAAVEVAFGASFAQLVEQKMKGAEDSDAGVSGADLKAIYNGGAPSLRSVSTTDAQSAIDGDLDAWQASQGQTWSPTDPDQDGGAASGGLYGRTYVSSVGLSLRAHTAAILLGGAFFNRVLGLVAAPPTEATLDSLLSAFGTTPAGLNGTNPGAAELLADYAARRGTFTRVRAALLTLKAAVPTGDKCSAERDAAVSIFLAEWERTTYATAITYLASASTLAADPTKGPEALAAFSSAAGFIASFKGLPATKRKISDSQIDALLGKIGFDTPYKLVTTPGDRSLKLNGAINDVALYESFTPDEVEAYKKGP